MAGAIVGVNRKLLGQTGRLVEACRRDERGATSVVFAIAFTCIFFAAALAIDYGFGSNEKFRQQVALDSAALAASEKLGLEGEDTAGKALAPPFIMPIPTRAIAASSAR